MKHLKIGSNRRQQHRMKNKQARCPLAPQAGCLRYGDALGAAEGDGATLSVTGFAVAAGETLAAGLVAAFGAVVAVGEAVGAAGEVFAAGAGVGIPINSLRNALSPELC